MSHATEGKQLELNELEWSPASFKVDDFLNRFSLPQIVRVNEGYYGDDEDSSLGAGQVLTLHLVKSTEKVFGHDYRGKEVNIPLNCPNKVEVRPSNLKDVYESVVELCSVFPNYVRISQGYYSVSKDEEILNVGDKLRLKTIDKSKKGQERLVCVNQNGTKIELPHDCIAGFQPLEDGKEYYLAEVAKQFSLPLYVQFVNPPTMGAKELWPTNEVVFNSSLGSIYLQKKYTENLVIASTVSNNGRRTVVTFPRDMDIRIAVSEDMLRNSPNYAQICRIINDGVDLSSLRHIDAHSAFKPRNSVREYSYKELVTYAPHMELLSETASKDNPSPETGSETTEVEQITPEAGQPTPELEQPSPEVEQPTPEVEQPTPEVEQPTPEVEQPEVEHLIPEVGQPTGEQPTPEVEQPTGEIQAAGAQREDVVPEAGPVSGNQTEKAEAERSGSTGKASVPGKPPRISRKPITKKDSLMKALEKNEGKRLTNKPVAARYGIKGSQSSKPDVPIEAATADIGMACSQTKDDQAQSPLVSSAENGQESSVTTVHTVEADQRKAPDVSACTVKQVSDILRELGMAKHVVKFESEMIDGEMLTCLDDDILMVDFGMTRLHCMKLRKYLKGWRPKV